MLASPVASGFFFVAMRCPRLLWGLAVSSAYRGGANLYRLYRASAAQATPSACREHRSDRGWNERALRSRRQPQRRAACGTPAARAACPAACASPRRGSAAAARSVPRCTRGASGDGEICRPRYRRARLSARRSSSSPLLRNDGNRPNRRRCAGSASAAPGARRQRPRRRRLDDLGSRRLPPRAAGCGAPGLPDVLHELDAVILQDALRAADRVALAVEQMADAAQQIDVVGPVIAAAAAALHRLDLLEAGFPEAQHVLRQVEIVRDFADRPECVGRLFHHRLPFYE